VGERLTYAGAGVDIAAGERAVDLIRPLVASTARAEVIGGLGGFGGLFAVPDGYRQPVLVAATDGVGTKLEIARRAGRFGTVGLDLVAMCVDDLVCQGAEPLFFLDYLAVGRLDPLQVQAVVAGIADGCRRAGWALLVGRWPSTPKPWRAISWTCPASPSAWSSVTGSSTIRPYSPRCGAGGIARHPLVSAPDLGFDYEGG